MSASPFHANNQSSLKVAYHSPAKRLVLINHLNTVNYQINPLVLGQSVDTSVNYIFKVSLKKKVQGIEVRGVGCPYEVSFEANNAIPEVCCQPLP